MQAATPSATPVSPHIRTAVVLGVIGALLLGLAVVAFAELSDHRVRKVEEIQDLTGTPPIGVIPTFSGKSTTPAAAEAFPTCSERRLGISTLTVRGARSSSRALPRAKGKTSVAVQLALACAEAGDNVILIDADLRHPQVADRLGVRAGPGLGAVLIGGATLEEAIVPYLAVPSTPGGRLGVLTASGSPPNPAQLCASRQMQELLDELERTADTVIIDTSPALMVADAFPLFKAASGTLLIARMEIGRPNPRSGAFHGRSSILGVPCWGRSRTRPAAAQRTVGMRTGSPRPRSAARPPAMARGTMPGWPPFGPPGLQHSSFGGGRRS